MHFINKSYFRIPEYIYIYIKQCILMEKHTAELLS